eukprot:7570146-Lingulodinium_polyedra.AAC.1
MADADESMLLAVKAMLAPQNAAMEVESTFPRGVAIFGGPPPKCVPQRNIATALAVAAGIDLGIVQRVPQADLLSLFLWCCNRRLSDPVPQKKMPHKAFYE